MDQNEFFNILMDGLKDFPEIKLQDVISYYENSFISGLATGKTEEEISNELGDPNLIVNKYRNEFLKTPINSEYITNDTGISPVSNTNNIDNVNIKNFMIDEESFIKDKIIVTDNSTNDTSRYFKTNNNFSNHKENDFKAINELNSFKTSNSYDGINSNDAFYDLNISDLCADNHETNYKSSNSNKTNFNSNVESDFSSNNNNENNTNGNSNQNSDYDSDSFNKKNTKNKISKFNVNSILRISIAILALIIFFPVITGIIGCILGLLGVSISILVGSIGLLVGGTFTNFIGLPNVPMFVANFPYPVIVLFSLGSISLSILLTLLFYYLCKFFIQISIKIYNSLKFERGAF